MDIKLLDRGMDYSVYLIKFKKNIEDPANFFKDVQFAFKERN